MKIKHYLLLIVCAFYAPSWAQSDTLDATLEKLIESFVETNEIEDFDFYSNFERLEALNKKRINLNKATVDDFGDLFFLNTIQIEQIISHRNKYGDYLCFEELQSLASLDLNTLRLLKYFITIDGIGSDNYDLKSYLEKGSSNLFLKYKRVLQQKKGYVANSSGEIPYAGSPDHYFLRYRFDSGKRLRFGFTAEKDPGEDFFSGNNKKGFDFYTLHVYFEKLKPWLKVLALGDYTMSFGQGLILNNNFGGGKSAIVTNIKRNDRAIKPYSSVNESNYFRGAAATFGIVNQLDVSLFYSNKNIDGTIQQDTLDDTDVDIFRSIARDGYHRTQSEIDKKESVNQVNYGGKLTYSAGSLRLSLNHLQYHFSNPLISDEALYKAFVFRGTKLSNTSIDYSYRFRNMNFFGEISSSDNGGLAQIHSVLVGLDKKVDLALSYRNYEKEYQVLEANAFSEGSLPINEKAVYVGLEVRPSNLWKISSYVDFWQNPWLRYRVDAPSTGREFLVRSEYTLKRKFSFYLQYRYEQKAINSSFASEKVTQITNLDLHRLRLQFNHKVNKEIELRYRAEISMTLKDDIENNGYLIYQDIIYKPIGKPYSFSTRYCLFDTDNFDTKIYTYENDLLYEYAIPFFQNQGRRFYINARYKPSRNLTIEGRYAITQYTNREIISSGNEEISGNAKSEVKAQIKYAF